MLINFENEIVEIVVDRVGWKRAWKPGEGGDLSDELWQEDRGKSHTYPFKVQANTCLPLSIIAMHTCS